jgi:hypothetical protein
MSNKIRKWMRLIHRDLSYIFAGMLLIYAISGIALNHKDTFNSQYSIERSEYHITPVVKNEINHACIQAWLDTLAIDNQILQYYFPDSTNLKVFLKGNSNMLVSLTDGHVVIEQVHKRPILGALSKLHYNPNKAWTWFSDLFAIAMIIVIITGIGMLKGKHGLWGIGGIELLIGMLIPLLFVLL